VTITGGDSRPSECKPKNSEDLRLKYWLLLAVAQDSRDGQVRRKKEERKWNRQTLRKGEKMSETNNHWFFKGIQTSQYVSENCCRFSKEECHFTIEIEMCHVKAFTYKQISYLTMLTVKTTDVYLCTVYSQTSEVCEAQ
jgi:hypothetical protein